MAKAPVKAKKVKQSIVEGALVVVKSKDDPQLGAYLSKAMEDAIKECHAEGSFAPEVIKERMKLRRDEAVAEYDRLMGGGG